MSFWDYLFDNEYKQRDDIEALKAAVLAAPEASGHTRRVIEHLTRQLNRQDLLLEALVKYLVDKDLLDRAGFAEVVAQLDLADGVEDGQVGPDKVAEAPKCPFCGHPRNPSKNQCVYCGEEITPEDIALTASAPPKQYVRCHKCFRRVEKDHSTQTIDGVYCQDCSG